MTPRFLPKFVFLHGSRDTLRPFLPPVDESPKWRTKETKCPGSLGGVWNQPEGSRGGGTGLGPYPHPFRETPVLWHVVGPSFSYTNSPLAELGTLGINTF